MPEENSALEVDTNFVVYMYVRVDGTPYYIGKGRPQRPYYKKGRPCGTPPRERIIILHSNIDEQEAFRIEKYLIAKYGRKDIGTGILKNRSDGGEGCSGAVYTEERRRKISESKLGEKHWAYKPRDWYNPKFGEILNKSCSDLVKEYSSENLNRGHLSQVALERVLHHKGWRLLKNKNLPSKVRKGSPRNWFHPNHGRVLNKSPRELMELFPEQNLGLSSLFRVASGVHKQHRGWFRLEDEYSYKGHANSIPVDWHHPDYGVLLQLSIPDLINNFESQTLKYSGLYQVAKGKKSAYKGWTVLRKSGERCIEENTSTLLK